jgi:protein TonB
MVAEKEAPPSAGFGVAGADFGGSSSGMTDSLFGGVKTKVQAAPPKKVNISAGVAVGLLIQKTTPVYPPIAKAARVSGTVVLQATISKTGSIEGLHVVSGPAMLQSAAMDAVKTWRYKPYLLNNEPVEVETTVNVIFTLGG